MTPQPTPPRLFERLDATIQGWLLGLRKLQARANQRRFVGHYIAGTELLRAIRHIRMPVDYWVQETSGHEPGAIDLSASILRIDTAVVTSIGTDHTANFRFPDIDVPDAIAREKGKLVEAVAPGGFACLNFDDPRVRAMATRTTQRVIAFGTSPDAEVRAENVRATWPGRLAFDLVAGGRTYPVTTRFVGTMMLTNVLGALAVVHGYGLPLEPAIARLATEEPAHERMNVVAGRDGKTYIVDTQKAPHWSVDVLVDDLQRIAIPHLTFVIGDISDTRGAGSAQYRKLVRRLAAKVETLVLAGRAAEYGAKLAENDLHNLVVAPTAFDVSRYLDSRPAGVVYLKSNATQQLWRVLDQVTPAANS